MLEKRASKAEMIKRIERRLCEPEKSPIEDLRERVDLAAVMHMLQESPDQGRFLQALYHALKKDGKLMVVGKSPVSVAHVAPEECI